MYICVHACVYICMCTHTYMCRYIHAQIHTHISTEEHRIIDNNPVYPFLKTYIQVDPYSSYYKFFVCVIVHVWNTRNSPEVHITYEPETNFCGALWQHFLRNCTSL